MGKRYFLIIQLFFFLSSQFCLSQTGRVTYSVVNLNESNATRVKKMKEELELMEFTLSYDREKSFFKKEKHIPKDQLISNIATVIIGAPSDFFQNLKNKESLHNISISNNMYQVDHSYKMKNWTLTTETVVIEKYTCYKAILKEYNSRTESYLETIAWYTPDIPASFGPIGYGGLPGLILQLQYKTSVFTATNIILNPKKVNIENIEIGSKITVKEQVKLLRKGRKVTED